MKAVYAVLVALSVLLAIFSTIYGLKLADMRAGAWNLNQAARDVLDRERDDAHLIVMAASVLYFLVAVGICVAGIICTRSTGWRIGLAVGVLAGLVMGIWSLMLSRAISFDEAFPAWIVAAVVYIALGIIGLVRREARPAQGF